MLLKRSTKSKTLSKIEKAALSGDFFANLRLLKDLIALKLFLLFEMPL